MFTQLNQYHVVLEVDPQFSAEPGSLQDIYVQLQQRQPGPAARLHRTFETVQYRRWRSITRDSSRW